MKINYYLLKSAKRLLCALLTAILVAIFSMSFANANAYKIQIELLTSTEHDVQFKIPNYENFDWIITSNFGQSVLDLAGNGAVLALESGSEVKIKITASQNGNLIDSIEFVAKTLGQSSANPGVATSTSTPVATPSPTASSSPSPVATASVQSTPTSTPTASASPSASPSATISASPKASGSPSASASASPKSTASSSPTPASSIQATPSSSPSPGSTPSTSANATSVVTPQYSISYTKNGSKYLVSVVSNIKFTGKLVATKTGKKTVKWILQFNPNVPNKILATTIGKGYALTLTNGSKVLAQATVK